MTATTTNPHQQLGLALLKHRLHLIMTEHFTIDELKELVVMTGLACDVEVDVIQSIATDILERSLPEEDIIALNSQWQTSVCDGVDCTIEQLRARFKIFA